MNVVIYTKDFEPITVLDLPLWLLEQMEKQGAIRIAVLKPPELVAVTEPVNIDLPQTVTIYCEKLRWKDGTTKPILITHDEELALILRPEWLPGQRQVILGYQKTLRSLTDSLIKAMRK